MKIWLIRGATLAGVLIFLGALHWLLAPLGFGWVVYALFGLVCLFLLVELVLRRRKRTSEKASWARWKAAMHERRARLAAIREVRRSLDNARRLGSRTLVRQARFAIVLAELHEAEGQSEKALEALAKVPVPDLPPLQAAIVRQARAQAYLHAGDAEGASVTLSPMTEPVGDAAIDASIELSRAAVALEEGDVEQADEVARSILERAEPHDELWDEALALRAAVLATRGEEEAAASLLSKLEDAGRRRLALLGSARVRGLLEKMA